MSTAVLNCTRIEKLASRILVVDDEPMIRQLMSLILHKEGHTVFEAESGEQAIEVLCQHDEIDLVLLDLSMPGINGFEVLHHIRQSRHRDAAVIIITADDAAEQIAKAFELGANDYITKPIIADMATIRINIQLNLALARKELVKSRQRYDLAASGANDGLWDLDLDTAELYVSQRWKQILGLAFDHPVHSPDFWIRRIHPADRRSFEDDLHDNLIAEADSFEHEHRIQHSDGSWRWVLCRGMAMRNDDGTAYRIAGWLTDITQDKMVDALTGLSNRISLVERIESCLERIERGESPGVAVLSIDLDNFKLINDSLGHEAGDRFLKSIAERLRANLSQASSLAARLGGDEFAVVIEDIEDWQIAAKVAQRIQLELCDPIELGEQSVYPGLSIGISFTRDISKTSADLLRESDTAMNQAKACGKGGYQVFAPQMHRETHQRLCLESELRAALDQQQFLLYYQPIVNLQTGALTGCEALIRWQHPQDGIVPAGKFICVVENSSLMITLGDFVLNEACRQLAEWNRQSELFRDVICNVNVSRMQLKHLGFVKTLHAAMQRHRILPRQLQLEITESSLFDIHGSSLDLLREIQDAGIKIALDDFGIGQSSLACLHKLPLDTLKIDRSFVNEMLENSRSEAIVRAIVTLAHGVELSACAEGIETQEQYDFVKQLKCSTGQGFFIGRPMPPDALLEFANQRKLSAVYQ